VYKQLSGDGYIAARFVDFGQGSDAWAKAGVMIRTSIDPDSAHATMALTGGEGGGATFQWRSSQGAEGESVWSAVPLGELPERVSIVRQGNAFSAWTAEPEPKGEWTFHGVKQVPMTDPVLLGVAVTSRAPGQLCTVKFDDVQLGGHVEGTLPGQPCIPVHTIVDSLRLGDPLPPPILVPNGGCTLHSDGEQCEFPDPPEDICSVQALRLDISAQAAERIFNEVLPPGDGPVGRTFYASPGPPPPGPHVCIINQVRGEIPLNDPTHFRVFGFPLDAGRPGDNYVPGNYYPNDWYADTDLWYELIYTPDGGWQVWVTDPQDFADVPSNAWVTIASSETGSEVGCFIPLAELDTDTPTFRVTAFCHTGDWGMFDPWSGDYYPLLGELLPVPGPVYTVLSGPPQIQDIQFQQVNWYDPDGNLVQENSWWGRMLYEYQPVDRQTYYLNPGMCRCFRSIMMITRRAERP